MAILVKSIDLAGRAVEQYPPRRSRGTGEIGHSLPARWAIFAKIAADAKTPPGQIGARLLAAKTTHLPKIHLGYQTDDSHQVDIDLGGP